MASIKAKIKVENANPSFGSYKLLYYCKQGIKLVLTGVYPFFSIFVMNKGNRANTAEKKGYLQILINLEALSSQIQ